MSMSVEIRNSVASVKKLFRFNFGHLKTKILENDETNQGEKVSENHCEVDGVENVMRKAVLLAAI